MAWLVAVLGLMLAVWSASLGLLGPFLGEGFINPRDQSPVAQVRCGMLPG